MSAPIRPREDALPPGSPPLLQSGLLRLSAAGEDRATSRSSAPAQASTTLHSRAPTRVSTTLSSRAPTRASTRAAWQIGRACDATCQDVASSDHQHPDELHTEHCLEVVEQLHELGVGTVTLIDGDTVLRDDLLLIAEAIVQRGIRCKPCVAGPGITRLAAEALAHMGIRAVSVGLDGNAFSHDDARARRGAHRAVLAAIEHLRSAGVDVTVHTRISRLTLETLDELFDTLRAYGVRRWQPILPAPSSQQFEVDPELAREELLALRGRLAEFRQRAHPAQIRWIPAPPPATLVIAADGTFTPSALTVPDALKGPQQ